jgi:hypothetical protein
MNNIRQLGDGVELVKESCFRPEGQWSIRRGKGNEVWSKTEGWKRYYEIAPNCIFMTADEAMQAWNENK